MVDSTAPRVSVITSYHPSHALHYAIQSVLWQTFTDFELIIIGEPVGRDAMPVGALANDPRLRWQPLTAADGGWQIARGMYIAYLDYMDVWHPAHLATLVAALQNSGADLAYSLRENIGPTGHDWPVPLGAPPLIPASTIMHTRTLPREIGAGADCRLPQGAPNTEFLQRAFTCGKKFCAARRLTVFKFAAAV